MIISRALFATWLFMFAAASSAANITGELKKWYPVSVDINVESLATSETANQPSPFLDYRYDVVFRSPGNREIRVPGFYAGDGQGHGEGAVWRTRFSPDEAGEWHYTVSFRQGTNVAINLDLNAGSPIVPDGENGSFQVSGHDSGATGFLRHGRLEYDGNHYLKFADGPYWIKGGIDSPENFFGFAGFDGTKDQSGGAGTSGLVNGLHRYPSHVNDWHVGDPDFSNAASGASGRGIVGAVNYLSSQGVNSIYFLPMNLGGDGRETYPFVGASGSDFDNRHYDVSKLYQWNLVLDHMQRKGIAAHIVLAETEAGNSNWLDNGTLGVERKLFYREMIARFSYLMAIKWNISEESRFAYRHQEADYGNQNTIRYFHH